MFLETTGTYRRYFWKPTSLKLQQQVNVKILGSAETGRKTKIVELNSSKRKILPTSIKRKKKKETPMIHGAFLFQLRKNNPEKGVSNHNRYRQNQRLQPRDRPETGSKMSEKRRLGSPKYYIFLRIVKKPYLLSNEKRISKL